jgi:hypothetical protein
VKIELEKDKFDYVKPEAKDLGDVPVIYGACSYGDNATGGPAECTSGLVATPGACTGGGTATAGSCLPTGGTNLT